MEKRDKLEKLKTLGFSFNSRSFPAKQILSADRLSFSYQPSTPLIEDFSLTVRAGDRICVIGKNGKGKTTLLKLLAGKLRPQSGSVAYHPKVVKGFYEQTNIDSLVDARTVEEEILYSGGDVDRQRARNICGAMMFEGDNALKRVSVLSGGEKSRVMLGKLLVTPVNLLLLDEPTNHLDMESTDAMLAAVDSFEGTVVMVTHNEMFLHSLAERIVVFQESGLTVFEGSYQEFLDRHGWEDENGSAVPGTEKTHKTGDAVAATPKRRQAEKAKRRERLDAARQAAKALGPIEKRMAGIEAEILEQEMKLEEDNQAMLDASRAKDGRLIAEVSQGIHKRRAMVDAKYDEMEQLSREIEERRATLAENT